VGQHGDGQKRGAHLNVLFAQRLFCNPERSLKGGLRPGIVVL
jgi:hypothetical protein